MDKENKNRFCDLIEKLSDEQMYLILVSLMSSDTLVDEKTCNDALATINQIIEAIETANISDIKRDSWLKRANSSKEIILKDMEMFKRGGENE